MTLRSFVAADALDISLYENLDLGEQMRSAMYYEKWTPNVVAVVNGKAVAAGGLRILWSGVGEVWLMLGKEFPALALPKIKRQLWAWMAFYDLRRVQAVVRCDWKEGNRFAEWSGMKHEGVMKKMYCDGSDANLWAVTI